MRKNQASLCLCRNQSNIMNRLPELLVKLIYRGDHKKLLWKQKTRLLSCLLLRVSQFEKNHQQRCKVDSSLTHQHQWEPLMIHLQNKKNLIKRNLKLKNQLIRKNLKPYLIWLMTMLRIWILCRRICQRLSKNTQWRVSTLLKKETWFRKSHQWLYSRAI